MLDTPLGTSVVADELRPCVSADHEHLCTSHEAGVDEDDFSSRGFAKVEALVDNPLVDDQLHDFGHVKYKQTPSKKKNKTHRKKKNNGKKQKQTPFEKQNPLEIKKTLEATLKKLRNKTPLKNYHLK